MDAATATWRECRHFLCAHPRAILPLGATEQHGPHLPQSTDTLLAEAVARQVAEQVPSLVLPALPIGYSWVWRDYPGTLSLSLDTFRAALADIASSLERWQCRSLLLLHGHGANVQPAKYALRELADGCHLRVLHLFYPHLEAVRQEAQTPMWGDGNFHAEEVETSMMLYLYPERVHMERAVREYPEPSADYEHSSRPLGELSESGVFGDATAAAAAKGARWFDMWVEAAAAMWRDFIERHER